jgi:hypothetical protein
MSQNSDVFITEHVSFLAIRLMMGDDRFSSLTGVLCQG